MGATENVLLSVKKAGRSGGCGDLIVATWVNQRYPAVFEFAGIRRSR